jgi:hypothetical protein
LTTLSLKGEVEPDIAALFLEQLAQLEPNDAPLTIDFTLAEITEGRIAAMIVDSLRATAKRIGGIELVGAPQILAHSLYRIGALDEATAAIQLIEPRLEIASSS